jgi:hypothetical protein
MDEQARAYLESLVGETQKIREEVQQLKRLVEVFISKIEVDTGQQNRPVEADELSEVFDPLKTKS